MPIRITKDQVDLYNKGEKDKTKQAKHAEKWWKDNGYDFKAIRISYERVLYSVSKDGITVEYPVYGGNNVKSKSVIESFISYFEMTKKCN